MLIKQRGNSRLVYGEGLPLDATHIPIGRSVGIAPSLAGDQDDPTWPPFNPYSPSQF